ncbi:MAG: hypothetical protein IIC50_16525 [Planctomycetes bacterium]|nr:hypothetical protein [Planctomycetota bacterium]
MKGTELGEGQNETDQEGQQRRPHHQGPLDVKEPPPRPGVQLGHCQDLGSQGRLAPA